MPGTKSNIACDGYLVAFGTYLRTGHRRAPDQVELKYNHNHDPAMGGSPLVRADAFIPRAVEVQAAVERPDVGIRQRNMSFPVDPKAKSARSFLPVKFQLAAQEDRR